MSTIPLNIKERAISVTRSLARLAFFDTPASSVLQTPIAEWLELDYATTQELEDFCDQEPESHPAWAYAYEELLSRKAE